MKRNLLVGLVGLLALVVSIGPGCGPGLPGGTSCVTPATAAQFGQDVLNLVNAQRQAIGLSQLTWNATLAQISADFACQMINDGFFSHNHPVTGDGPSQRATAGGYAWVAIAENIAAGQQTPQAVMNIWMNSTGHKANILNPVLEEMGLGVREGGQSNIYWVQMFGDPP